MEFNKQIYPEKLQDKLENAVENSAENFIQNKIDEEDPSCGESGSNFLLSQLKNKNRDFNKESVFRKLRKNMRPDYYVIDIGENKFD